MASAPPPLKRRRRDDTEQPALGALALDLSEIQDDEEGAGRPNDDDATEGEWLFKQDDVVLGPVSAAVLVQRIEAGELSADTPLGREAGKWRPLKAVPYFQEILDKVEAQKRALLEQLEREARLRRQRIARWSALAGLFVVPFLLGAVAGRAVWIAKPWDRGDEWLQRPPPLVDLPVKPKPAAPPEEKRVVDSRADEAEDDEPEDDDRVAEAEGDAKSDKKATASKRTAKKASSSKKAADTKKQKPAEEPKQVAVAKADEKKEADSAGGPLPTLTQQQVMAPVLKNQAAIGNCLKAEVARNPDIPSRVTLMWTVTEAGRATGFKLKEREVRTGPLATCLSALFDNMRWPRFTGERKNVELPLSVKK